MILPLIPPNETARLKALHELFILDTPPEERFDRLARVAKNALEVPYAFVNLIDSENQWCKSSPGHEPGITPRNISFCAHTILTKEPLIVCDAAEDQRFHDNPLVVQAPGFRSYLGVPLFSKEGLCLGALCVLDTKPRKFPQGEIDIVRDLALAVQNEITNIELNKSVEATRQIRALPGHEKDTPWIIACTADAMPEDRQKCLEAGMNDYTSKPLKPATLHAALTRYAQELK